MAIPYDMCRICVTTATHAHTHFMAGKMYLFFAVRINRSDESIAYFLKILSS